MTDPFIDAVETARLVRTRQVSPTEVVQAAISRVENLQTQLNFMTTASFDQALEQAGSVDVAAPFAGVPFMIKDLDDVVGLPTGNGSRSSMGAAPATVQAPNVTAYQTAGLISIGKSSSPEFGFLPTTEPLAYGPTRNPWNYGRSAGGSSGGAAAAVAAGVVPIAHASDGGGSIRIPASVCGLIGLKPSRGRMIPANPSPRRIQISVHHCVSRTVRDCATMFATTERTRANIVYPPVGLVSGPGIRRLRIGVLTETLAGLEPDPEVSAAVGAGVRLLRDLGHRLEETAWPIDGQMFSDDFLTLWASGAAELVQAVRQASGREPDESVLEPFTLSMAESFNRLPAGGLEGAVDRLNACILPYRSWFDRFDVILSPVLGMPPVPIGWAAPNVPFELLIERLNAYVGYTTLHNVVGAPAISLPLHWTQDGLPVGIQFAGDIGDERTLLELAFELEPFYCWPKLPTAGKRA